MTQEQCRQARHLIGWSRPELADKASVPVWFVAMFEDKGDPDESYTEWEVRMLYALEAAGARFPFEIADGLTRPAPVFLSGSEDGKSDQDRAE